MSDSYKEKEKALRELTKIVEEALEDVKGVEDQWLRAVLLFKALRRRGYFKKLKELLGY